MINSIKNYFSPRKSGPSITKAATNDADRGVLKNNADATATQTKDSVAQNSSKPKSAPLDERFFIVGVAQDVLKTIPRILTGSFFSSIVNNYLKNSYPSLESIIYSTALDDLFSRFLADTVNSVTVRFFNGKTKFFGITVPKLLPELASQIFATPTVVLARTLTNKFNIDRRSAKNNLSKEEEKNLKPEILKQPFVKYTTMMNDFYKNNLKDKMDSILEFCIGVRDGKEIKDSEGNLIMNEEGKPLKTDPIVNYTKLGSVIVGSFLGTLFLLPKKAQAVGFDDVKSPLRGLVNIIWTTLCRLQTNVISSSTGMHAEGKNFDACFENSVIDKTFIPFVQYTADAVAALLSRRLPFFNGASLSIILRTIFELPATFLKTGLTRIAKDNRVGDDWNYLSHRVLKPFIKAVEFTTKPIFKFLGKNIYWRLPIPFIWQWGIFNPNIPQMYDHDIQENEQKAKEGAEKYETNLPKTLGLLAKKVFTWPIELVDLWQKSRIHDQELKANLQAKIDKHEAQLKEKRAQEAVEAKLRELGLDQNKAPSTNNQLHQASKPIIKPALERKNDTSRQANNKLVVA